MKIEKADKMKGFEAGIFTILNEKKLEVERTGRKIYNFSIGTPDFKPFPHIMKTVSDACLKPENYKYSITDMEELVEAVLDGRAVGKDEKGRRISPSKK